jgi:hypothetical protein
MTRWQNEINIVPIRNYILELMNVIVLLVLFLYIQSVLAVEYNCESYSFETGKEGGWNDCGYVGWTTSDSDHLNGTHALMSECVNEVEQQSAICREAQGPADIEFWWKKSQILNDQSDLIFLDDGFIKRNYSDRYNNNWAREPYAITDNRLHVLRWEYKLRPFGKVTKYSIPSAAGWIDDVTICRHEPLPEIKFFAPSKICRDGNVSMCIEIKSPEEIKRIISLKIQKPKEITLIKYIGDGFLKNINYIKQSDIYISEISKLNKTGILKLKYYISPQITSKDLSIVINELKMETINGRIIECDPQRIDIEVTENITLEDTDIYNDPDNYCYAEIKKSLCDCRFKSSL